MIKVLLKSKYNRCNNIKILPELICLINLTDLILHWTISDYRTQIIPRKKPKEDWLGVYHSDSDIRVDGKGP